MQLGLSLEKRETPQLNLGELLAHHLANLDTTHLRAFESLVSIENKLQKLVEENNVCSQKHQNKDDIPSIISSPSESSMSSGSLNSPIADQPEIANIIAKEKPLD